MDQAGSAVRIALCTCPNEDAALRIADSVVGGRHAACVNIVPGITSVYRWEGAIQRDGEVLLVIKTTVTAWPELEAAIVEAHPYELPELIAVPVVAGLEAYLGWVRDETAK